MSYGAQQIEHLFDRRKPGGEGHTDAFRRANKKNKIRKERRRAKEDPECHPQYRKYDGWEY